MKQKPKTHVVAVSRRSLNDRIEFNSLCDIQGAASPGIDFACETIRLGKNNEEMNQKQRSDYLKTFLRNMRVVKVQNAPVQTRNGLRKVTERELEFLLHIYYDPDTKRLINLLETCLIILNVLCLKGCSPPLSHRVNIMDSITRNNHAVKLFSIMKHDVQDTALQAKLFGFLVSCGRKDPNSHEFDEVAVQHVRRLTQAVDGVHQLIRN